MDIIDWSRKIGNHDSSEIMKFISSLPAEDWNEFTDRQTRFTFHKYTQCIAGLFPDRSNWPKVKLETFKHSETLSKLVQEVCFNVSDYYQKEFKVTTAMVVKMQSNSEIESHSDTHPYFGETHRVHWCLEGDYENMHFVIAGNKIPMMKGDVIEINNRLPHHVVYDGDSPRYNLIIDFAENQEE
jgi:hypothetical protein